MHIENIPITVTKVNVATFKMRANSQNAIPANFVNIRTCSNVLHPHKESLKIPQLFLQYLLQWVFVSSWFSFWLYSSMFTGSWLFTPTFLRFSVIYALLNLSISIYEVQKHIITQKPSMKKDPLKFCTSHFC